MAAPVRLPSARDIAEIEATYASSRDFVRARLARQRVPADDIDDLRQEVFLVALRKQPHLYDAGATRAWLGKVCDFVALAHHRRAYRRHEVSGDLSETAAACGDAAGAPDPDASDWAADQLHGALSLLSAREREMIALRLAADMPFRTLAELHECDVKTVRKRFQSAVGRLQHHLQSGSAPTSESEPESGFRRRLLPGQQEPSIGASSSTLALGALDHTLIVSWGGGFNDQALERFLSFGEALVQEQGAGLRCLSVVEPSWPAPRFEDRARLAEALRFLEHHCEAFSLVGADHNYRLAEQILCGLGFLQQARYPFGTFNDLRAGASWLVSRDRRSPEAAPARTRRLVKAVEETQELAAAQSAPPRVTRAPELVNYGVKSSLALSSLGQVLITSWSGPVTQAAVNFLVSVADDLRAEQGRPLAHLSVVEPESPRPRFAERQRLLEIARHCRRNLGAFAFVAAASNQRIAEQIMRGMGFLVRSSLQLYAAKGEADGAEWLTAQIRHADAGCPLSAAQLLSALQETRNQRG